MFFEGNMSYQSQIRGGVRFVDEIPRNIIGKVDRQYFKRLVNSEILSNWRLNLCFVNIKEEIIEKKHYLYCENDRLFKQIEYFGEEEEKSLI